MTIHAVSATEAAADAAGRRGKPTITAHGLISSSGSMCGTRRRSASPSPSKRRRGRRRIPAHRQVGVRLLRPPGTVDADRFQDGGRRQAATGSPIRPCTRGRPHDRPEDLRRTGNLAPEERPGTGLRSALSPPRAPWNRSREWPKGPGSAAPSPCSSTSAAPAASRSPTRSSEWGAPARFASRHGLNNTLMDREGRALSSVHREICSSGGVVCGHLAVLALVGGGCPR